MIFFELFKTCDTTIANHAGGDQKFLAWVQLPRAKGGPKAQWDAQTPWSSSRLIRISCPLKSFGGPNAGVWSTKCERLVLQCVRLVHPTPAFGSPNAGVWSTQCAFGGPNAGHLRTKSWSFEDQKQPGIKRQRSTELLRNVLDGEPRFLLKFLVMRSRLGCG